MEDFEVINNKIRIENVKANRAIEFKQELEKDGLILNVDFEWRWHSPANHYVSNVEFIFNNPIYATFYKLRWE